MQIKKKTSYTFSEITKERINELAKHHELSATATIEKLVKDNHELIFGKPKKKKG